MSRTIHVIGNGDQAQRFDPNAKGARLTCNLPPFPVHNVVFWSATKGHQEFCVLGEAAADELPFHVRERERSKVGALDYVVHAHLPVRRFTFCKPGLFAERHTLSIGRHGHP